MPAIMKEKERKEDLILKPFILVILTGFLCSPFHDEPLQMFGLFRVSLKHNDCVSSNSLITM